MAIAGGVRLIQYRNKTSPRKTIYETALRIAWMAKQAGVLFLVNDHTDIAAAVDADGVHLGQEDLPLEHARSVLGREKIIGLSTHSPEQAAAAQAAGADYIGFGPLFRTATKDAGPAQGVHGLASLRSEISIPILAIGGINHENVKRVIRAGADGVAVISAILSSRDRKDATREMIRRIGEAVSET